MKSATKKLLDQLVTYTPVDEKAQRVRLGRLGDGGYIVLSPYFESIERFYSYGINDDFSFDVDLQKRSGAVGRLFDPNVNYPECPAEHLFFRKVGLATGEGSLIEHIASYGDTGKRMLLKADVEGAEWKWLAETTDEDLDLFDHVCLELHFLGGREEHGLYADCLERLNQHFYLFHVHSNNFFPLEVWSEGLLPPLLECSYVSKKLCECRPNSSVKFPIPGIDWPCVEAEIENNLDFWPFITAQNSEEEHRAVTEAKNRAALRARLAENTKRIASLELELRNLKQSASWKLGGPIRALIGLLRNR